MTTYDSDETTVKRYLVTFFDDSTVTVTAARVVYGNGFVEFHDEFDRRLGRFDLGMPAGVFVVENLGPVTS